MQTVRIVLHGEPATKAQHLARELLESGAVISPDSSLPAEDRSVAGDFALSILASGAYDAIRAIVLLWIKRNSYSESEVDIHLDESSDQNGDTPDQE